VLVGVRVVVESGVALGVALGVGLSLGVAVGAGGGSDSSTPVTSATVTRPSPLTSVSGHVLASPKMTATTAARSAASTC